jgi:hypothetical protein
MRMLPLRRLAPTFLLFAACGGANGGGGGSSPIPEDELPTELAELICGLVHGQCECEDPAEADEATCIDSKQSEFEENQADAQAAGLTYDAECAGRYAGGISDLGCDSSSSSESGDCDYCAIYHGDVAEGETCVAFGSFSDCAQGLLCSGGTCYDPCGGGDETLGEGEDCDPVAQEPPYCDYLDDLVCDPETMTCVALPGIGEECPLYLCAQGAICDTETMMCVALPGEGEPCVNEQCGSGAVCEGGTCVALPPAICGWD